MIKVKTNALHQAARRISNCNDSIQTAFNEMDRNVANLKSTWYGNASSAAIDAYKRIKVNYNSNRYALVAAFTRFLEDQAAIGYEETEGELTLSAKQFK